MRIGILALLHESNTFISSPTTIRHFQDDVLLAGAPIRERFLDTHHEIGGFFEGIKQAGGEAIPIFAARALPYGPIDHESYRELLRRMLEALSDALPVDGLLVAPHGATVSQQIRDVDGDWMSRVRQHVGPNLPIIGTLDPHANLSHAMIDATNALIAYRTNPHLDQRQRGIEAADLLARTIEGKVRPTQAAAFPPLAINIERQCTSDSHCRHLYDAADEQLRLPRVLSNSIVLGFPYADVEEMGSATIAVTNDDAELANRLAMLLASRMWSARESFRGQLVEADEALRACESMPGPTGLLDMGDNVGGGSPGDGTHLLHAIHRHGMMPAFACLYDPESVERCIDAGIGRQLELSIGGKTDHLHGAPYIDHFTVTGIHDGRFMEPEVRHGGLSRCDQGTTVVIAGASGITVMLTARRMPPFSLRQVTSFGVDPRAFRVLVVKGVHAPVAAYREVCPRMIRVNTSGCTTADMRTLDYVFRRRPLFPFEDSAEFNSASEDPR